MRTKTKVIIDESAGRLLVALLNLVARILGRILRIDHSLDMIPERIVVCKFLGMGSLIQSTPLLQTLRKSFPSADIIFITSLSNLELLQRVRAVDETWTINDKNFVTVLGSTWTVLLKLWKKKPDLYIDLETYSYYSTVLATISKSRNRLGFYRVERNIRMGVYTHMMFFNSRAPIAESYLQMARLAGCREIVTELYPFTTDTGEESQAAGILRQLFGGDFPYIVINPNASDLRVERRWPADNFIQAISRLSSAFPGYRFVLSGSVRERDYVQKLHKRLDPASENVTADASGKFSLGQLFAVIKNASLLITNDTGPMHISFALRKNTLCLFGPASPVQYGKNPFAHGLYKNLYCSPCVHDFLTPPCLGNNQCMKLITVGEVVALASGLLTPGNTGQIPVMTEDIQFTYGQDQKTLGIVLRK